MHRQLFSPFKFKKTTLLIVLGVVFLLSVFATAAYNVQRVSATTTAASKSADLDWQVQSWWYYNAMTQCMHSVGSWNISKSSDVDKGNWFYTGFTLGTVGDSPAGWYMQDNIGMGDDGQINCNENSNQLTTKALSFWGLSGIDVMCGAGILVRENNTPCADGNGDFNWATSGQDEGPKFSKYIQKTIYGGDTPSLTNAMKYVLYRQTLVNACMPPNAKAYDKDPGGSIVYKIADIDTSKTPASTVIHYYIGNQPDTFNAWVSTNPNKAMTCKQLASAINSTNAGSLAAAAASASDKGTTIIPSGDKNNNPDGSPKTTCSIDGIGWILCPVANAIAGMTDALFSAVTAFMQVAPLNLSPDKNPLYNAWSVMRTIANVAFVVVFLIIIFSQLTSTGVSNYGVKKLLPRLVVGAILVNVSFYLCAIAVDLSNILGVGVQQLFDGINTATANTGDSGANWGSIMTTVLAGTGTLVGTGIAIETFASGGLWGAIAALLPLVLAALVALIIAFLVLLARQALIIMAIVLSPLAFVAYLLPNTEGLFKKWRDLFISLLVLFPMLSIVFGASGLAAIILRSTSNAQLNDGSGNMFIAFFLYIGSFAVQAIPFFITPLLIKLSTGVLGRFAGIVNNPKKGPIDRLKKGSERIANDAQNRRMARKVGAGGMLNFGARRRARVERTSAGLEGTAKYNAGEYINSELGKTDQFGNPSSKLATRMAAGDAAAGAIISAKAIASTESEHLKEAMQPLLRQLSTMAPEDKRAFLTREIDQSTAPGGDPSRASAALHYTAQIGDTGYLRQQLGKGGEIERMTREAINANPSAVIGKAPDLVKGTDAAFSSIKGSDLVQFKPDTAKAYVEHLQKLSASTDPADMVKFKTAIDGFNSAVEDISKSPELQGQFSAEVGTVIEQLTQTAGFRQQMSGIAAIQSDGKIR